MIKKITAYFFICLFLVHPLKAGDDFCGIKNFAFNSGEEISYNLYYSVIGLYINAGSAKFGVAQEKINETASYHVTCIGTSNSRYDWIFKVRDKYESIVDAKTLLPYYFSRSINEGGFHQNQNLTFNQKSNEVLNDRGDTFKSADCTFDVISAIYAARNLDFRNLQVNDKVYLNFFLDNELFPSYFKYLGKEIVQTKFVVSCGIHGHRLICNIYP